MMYRTNKETSLTEVCIIGTYNVEYYVVMIVHYVDDETIEIFHFMPLTEDDTIEFDFKPNVWYNYPKRIMKKQEREDGEGWWG